MARGGRRRAGRRARGRDDALRHRRRARRRLLRRAARALRGLGSGRCAERHPGLIVHAANSAALLRDADSHFDLVRCGRRDLRPGPVPGGRRRARPRARAGARQLRRRGQALRAGRERRLRAALRGASGRPCSPRCRSATATACSRALTNNADVLVGGRRFPLVGTVSMDNVALDLGADGGGVERGDEALLIGAGPAAPRRWRGAWARSTTRSRAR